MPRAGLHRPVRRLKNFPTLAAPQRCRRRPCRTNKAWAPGWASREAGADVCASNFRLNQRLIHTRVHTSTRQLIFISTVSVSLTFSNGAPGVVGGPRRRFEWYFLPSMEHHRDRYACASTHCFCMEMSGAHGFRITRRSDYEVDLYMTVIFYPR